MLPVCLVGGGSSKRFPTAFAVGAHHDKTQKVNTIKNMWIPAINNYGAFGEWEFLELTDPWNMQNIIREFMSEYAS